MRFTQTLPTFYIVTLFFSICTLYPKLINARRLPPRKIIVNVSVNNDIQLKKAENAWKPGMKRESVMDDSEALRTQVCIPALLLLLSISVWNIHSKRSTQDVKRCTLEIELDGCPVWWLLFLSGTRVLFDVLTSLKSWFVTLSESMFILSEGCFVGNSVAFLAFQELFRKVRSILNKLTPQMFHQLMKQVTDLTINTEERLKGIIDLVFEKAIDEPSFSVAYANMCRCLATVRFMHRGVNCALHDCEISVSVFFGLSVILPHIIHS